MEIYLYRTLYAETHTIGKLYVNGHFYCDTLEDRVRNGEKVPNETAIPAGRYRVKLTHSPKFNRLLPLLLDVPNFSAVRIHAGNTAADTAGCVLVGENRENSRLINSRYTEQRLVELLELQTSPIYINIKNS